MFKVFFFSAVLKDIYLFICALKTIIKIKQIECKKKTIKMKLGQVLPTEFGSPTKTKNKNSCKQQQKQCKYL